mmetsp:Transcript_38819/g.90493  ORF Transcript_38819/g.90493 Transcript_38819/m.90493 type:complete len:662 (-) Transcript_38819:35-2020(-)
MATTAAMQKRGPYAVDLRVLAELEKNKLALRANAVGGICGEKVKRATSAHQPSTKQAKALKRRPVSATTAELGLRSAVGGGGRGNFGVLNGIGMRDKDGAAQKPRAASGTKRSTSNRKKENVPTTRPAGRSGASAPSAPLNGSSGGRGSGKVPAGLDSKHTTEIGTLRSIYTQSHTKPSSVAAASGGRPRSSQPAWGASPPTTLAPVSVPTAAKEPPRASSASSASRSATSSIRATADAAAAAAAPPVVGRPAPPPSPSPSPDAEVLMESSRSRATMPELVAKYRNAPSIGDLEGGAWETGAMQRACAPSSGSGSGGRARPASAGRLRAPAAAAVTAAEPDAGSVRSSAEMVREWKRSCAGGGDVWAMGKSGDAAGSGGGSCPGSPGLRGSLDDGVIGLAGSNPQTPEGVVQRWKEESKERMRGGKAGPAETTRNNMSADIDKDDHSKCAPSTDSQGAPAGETVSRVRKKLLGSMEGAATVVGGGLAGGEARMTYTERIRGLTGATTPLVVQGEEVLDRCKATGIAVNEDGTRDTHSVKESIKQGDSTGIAGSTEDAASSHQHQQSPSQEDNQTRLYAAGKVTPPETSLVKQQTSGALPGAKIVQRLPSPPKAKKSSESVSAMVLEMEGLVDNAVWTTLSYFFSSEPLLFGGFVGETQHQD